MQVDQNGDPLYPRLYKQSLVINAARSFSRDCPYTTPAGEEVDGALHGFYRHKRIDPPSNPSCQMEFPIGDTDMEDPGSTYIRYGGYRVSVDGLAPSDSSTPTSDVFDVKCGKEYEYTVTYDEGFEYNGEWQPSGVRDCYEGGRELVEEYDSEGNRTVPRTYRGKARVDQCPDYEPPSFATFTFGFKSIESSEDPQNSSDGADDVDDTPNDDENTADQSGSTGQDTGSSSGEGAGVLGEVFGGKEYRWIKERKTQAEAEAHAEGLGGHLVVINSAAEDDFVYSMVRGASLSGLGTASDGGGVSYVWLGANDARVEGAWNWVNGDPFTYTNWGRAEPDNYLNQDGLGLGLQNWPSGSSGSSAFGLAGEWNDIDRSNRMTFIVELPLNQGNEETEEEAEEEIEEEEEEEAEEEIEEEEEGEEEENESSDADAGDEDGGESVPFNGQNVSGDFNSAYDLSVSSNNACAVDDNGIACWGDLVGMSTYRKRPPSTKALKVFLSVALRGCVIDDGEVKCWGTSFDGAAEVPELINPVAVDTEAGVSCAIHDGGVKCWGQNNDGMLDVPDLVNPSEISIGFVNVCAIDKTGLVCWGADTVAPFLKNLISRTLWAYAR